MRARQTVEGERILHNQPDSPADRLKNVDTVSDASSDFATEAPATAGSQPQRRWSPALTRAGDELVAWFKTLASAAVSAPLSSFL